MSKSTTINELQEKAVEHLLKAFREVRGLKGKGDAQLSESYMTHINALIQAWRVIGLDSDYIQNRAHELLEK